MEKMTPYFNILNFFEKNGNMPTKTYFAMDAHGNENLILLP